MRLRYGTFPYASLEGTPVLAVSEPGDGWKTLDLSAILRDAYRQGYRAIQIEDAPWGEDGWDRELHRAMSTPEISGLEFISVRPLGATHWSPLQLLWVFDVSDLVTKPTSASEIRGKIMRLGHHPRPAEVIIINPDPANIVASVLDEIHEQTNVQFGCYLYLDDTVKGDEAEAAMRLAFPKLASIWTCRRITRSHAMNEQSWEPVHV